MITLENYDVDAGFLGGQQDGAVELQKAMQAGAITGRDTTGQLLTQEPLKAESLDKTLKLLEFRTQDIKLWNAISKTTAYNTVEEFLQLSSYGTDRGGFYDEGELSDVEDSKYVRRSELVKYMQVTGEVTMQAQMVRSYVDAMKKEVENKMMWIMRLVNRNLTTGDSEIISQQFNGIYKQHASIGSGQEYLFQTFEQYYNDETVIIDLRGQSLKQQHIQDASVNIDLNYGNIDTLFAPTTVISGLAKDYFQSQRILLGGSMSGNQGFTGGAVPKAIATTLGDVALMSDKFMKADPPKMSSTNASSNKAPAAPTFSTVALASDSLSKYTGTELGDCFYAVSAINRYGESALTVNSTAVTLVAGSRVDLTIAAGSGAYAAQGYVIYRTKVTTQPTPAGLEFFPIFKVSTAQLAGGYNGATSGKIGDRGYYLPGMEQAFATEMTEEIMTFKQLAPISKLDLAVLSMSRRFITFLFGTPQLFAPRKVYRFINVNPNYTQS
jgi:hypothetical protein